jgi:hypothetical protein
MESRMLRLGVLRCTVGLDTFISIGMVCTLLGDHSSIALSSLEITAHVKCLFAEY